jgi:hypothetical protein
MWVADVGTGGGTASRCWSSSHVVEVRAGSCVRPARGVFDAVIEPRICCAEEVGSLKTATGSLRPPPKSLCRWRLVRNAVPPASACVQLLSARTGIQCYNQHDVRRNDDATFTEAKPARTSPEVGVTPTMALTGSGDRCVVSADVREDGYRACEGAAPIIALGVYAAPPTIRDCRCRRGAAARPKIREELR